SLLGGVYSYLSGLCENRYEYSCKKLLAECISAVLAGFIGIGNIDCIQRMLNRNANHGICQPFDVSRVLIDRLEPVFQGALSPGRGALI
ncbi:hypothetical protein O5629_27225, partial [Escherichia coli]|nr:hypothetical protein [Escherichia coli]